MPKSEKGQPELSNYELFIHCQWWGLVAFAGSEHSLCARMQHGSGKLRSRPACILWNAMALTDTPNSTATKSGWKGNVWLFKGKSLKEQGKSWRTPETLARSQGWLGGCLSAWNSLALSCGPQASGDDEPGWEQLLTLLPCTGKGDIPAELWTCWAKQAVQVLIFHVLFPIYSI